MGTAAHLSAGWGPGPADRHVADSYRPRESFVTTCLQAGGHILGEPCVSMEIARSRGSGSQMRTGASPRLALSSDHPLGSRRHLDLPRKVSAVRGWAASCWRSGRRNAGPVPATRSWSPPVRAQPQAAANKTLSPSHP